MLAQYQKRREAESSPVVIQVLKFHDLPEGATTPRITSPDEKGRLATQVDFYNPSKVMEIGGEEVLAVRREPHETEISIVEFFHRDEAGEWGGVNDLHILKDGRIGIVGHVARMVDGKKDYYAAICVFDPKTRTHTDWEIIATADDLAQAGINIKPKKEDLGSVYYPSGSVRNAGYLDLYAGVGDTASVLDRRNDRFLKYEV